MNINTEQYFSMVPSIEVPRSTFDRSFTHKMTMNTDYLYPIFIDESLPGDSMKMDFQAFGRIVNPLVVPVMDELYFETLWFKADCRLLWNNWERFCGQQDNPTDSVDYVIPLIYSSHSETVEGVTTDIPNTAFTCGELADCFGIPPYIKGLKVNALPFRMYNRVWNEWFRDENLQNSVVLNLDDQDEANSVNSPGETVTPANYRLLKSNKIHDYFTSCLPTTQKGAMVNMPIGIMSNGAFLLESNSTAVGTQTNSKVYGIKDTSGNLSGVKTSTEKVADYYAGLQTSGLNVQDFIFAMKLQQKRYRDMQGGTRYIEWLRMHFHVNSSDARFHRTEFLGSTREMIDINTVVQTSSTDSTSPQGNLTAFGVVSHHGAGFETSFEEHGYLLGLARIRHNPIYQQGLHKMWKRSTLLDFYLPVFNGIGEQPVYNYELAVQRDNNVDGSGNKINEKTFGFNEAWAEYRFKPSYISGLLRSENALATLYPSTLKSLDIYHLAQNFDSVPVLNSSFIEEGVPLDRVISVTYDEDVEGDNPLNYPQFIFDFRFNYICARCMPVRDQLAGLDRF